MAFKPVDTAIVMVIGPCIDDTDFKSLEESIAYDAAGMDVSLIVEKTDGTTTVTAITLTTGGTSDWTHKDGGYYEIEVTAAQNAEEGIAYLRGICTGVLPFESPRYSIVKANIYDSLIKGTDVLQTDVTQLAGVAQSLTDLKDLADTGYDPVNHKIQSDLIYIHGSAITETAGQLAAAFTKLFDVATPLLVASDVMRGTDSAALAATALTDVTWTDAKAAFIDASVAAIPTTAMRGTDNAALAATALSDVVWTDAKAAFLDHSIATVDGNVDAILLDTGTDGVLLSASATSAQLISDNWDELLTGATHNIATSAGRRVREIGAFAIHSGTAQAGNSIHLTLAATASATDGIYNRNLLVIVGGTGVGQTRTIVDYDGTTKVALADREWRVSPDATSEYQITPDDTPLTVDHGLVQAATESTITIRDYASSVDNTYLCNIVIILAGTGRGQARLVSSYNGTTKVITICGDNWVTTPDTDSIYALIPYGASCVGCLADAALAQINTECDTALTDYDGPTRAEATTDKAAIITEVDANETKIDTLQTDSTAIKAKTDNLPSGIAKNVALSDFQWLMVLTSDHVTAATGKTVVGTISKDGGAFGALTNAIAEIGNGLYKVDLTQTEMNADVITLKFTEIDCDQRTITVYTV